MNVKKNKRRDGIEPCTCGHNRWKTVKKEQEWSCHKCGKIRQK